MTSHETPPNWALLKEGEFNNVVYAEADYLGELAKRYTWKIEFVDGFEKELADNVDEFACHGDKCRMQELKHWCTSCCGNADDMGTYSLLELHGYTTYGQIAHRVVQTVLTSQTDLNLTEKDAMQRMIKMINAMHDNSIKIVECQRIIREAKEQNERFKSEMESYPQFYNTTAEKLYENLPKDVQTKLLNGLV